MFAQMIQFIRWMHQTMHCCNLDISLENMLIRDCAFYDEESKTLKKCYIKFIDFGLCEFFDLKTNPKFLCQKYVGKTHYKAPKVYGKKEIFQANKADIWSLGVSLFMMIIGAPPYNKPIDKDITFQYIKYKQIAKLLQEWGRIKYVTSNLHDLLTKMLTFDEDKRITLDEIIKHPWIKHYFPNENVPKPSIQQTQQTQQHQQPYIQSQQAPPKLPPKLSIGSINNGSSQRDIPPSPSYSNQGSQSGITKMNNNPQLNIMIPNQAVSSMSGSVYHTPSVSRTSRGSQGSIGSYNSNRKYSSPYSPIVPHSPNSQQHQNGVNTPTPIIQSYSKNDNALYLAAAGNNDNGPRRSHSDVDKHHSKNIKYNKHKSRNGHKSRKKAHSDVTNGENMPPNNINYNKNNKNNNDKDKDNKDKNKRKHRQRKKSSGKKDKKKKSKKFFKLNLPLFGGN